MCRRDLLIFALHLIKDECDKHDAYCTNCPFWSNKELKCVVKHETPEGWVLPDLFYSDGPIEPIF